MIIAPWWFVIAHYHVRVIHWDNKGIILPIKPRLNTLLSKIKTKCDVTICDTTLGKGNRTAGSPKNYALDTHLSRSGFHLLHSFRTKEGNKKRGGLAVSVNDRLPLGIYLSKRCSAVRHWGGRMSMYSHHYHDTFVIAKVMSAYLLSRGWCTIPYPI